MARVRGCTGVWRRGRGVAEAYGGSWQLYGARAGAWLPGCGAKVGKKP
ncbi:hypothetical protein F383_15888 [Gossypium arboreum]|uniref:Uncharacterized protein n=1 Tax=Gossypium arboreum TaxID=29729 RepID=A0A0B0M5W1_GOSAR|nr:hypothetical protein F383_15888 [Gossypium arboreum]